MRIFLPDRESNPDLTRDGRGYSPLYYRGCEAEILAILINNYLPCITMYHRSWDFILLYFLFLALGKTLRVEGGWGAFQASRMSIMHSLLQELSAKSASWKGVVVQKMVCYFYFFTPPPEVPYLIPPLPPFAKFFQNYIPFLKIFHCAGHLPSTLFNIFCQNL